MSFAEKLCNPVISTSGRAICYYSKSLYMRCASKTIQMSARPVAFRTRASLNAPPEFTRSSWTDFFLNDFPHEDLDTQRLEEQEVIELKEQVRKELLLTVSHKPMFKQLQLIDDIQRLGIGYHFEDEIEAALNQIYETYYCLHRAGTDRDDLDLYHASLLFRLLRRHGFYVSCDIFKQFLDTSGNIKASLCSDVDGMLSLYEASHVRTHGDDILDEALTFTTTHLKLTMNTLTHPLLEKVARALEKPLHKGVARLEARYYISLYELNPLHSKVLLKFAKLDYNMLQSLHRKELGDLTRWCYGFDVFSRLPCKVREITAEIYYCALGTLDERKEYSFGRMVYFKLILVGTIIDDLYDVCEIDDLELLTEAIQRWDKRCASQLPDSLKIAYIKLLDTFEEIEKYFATEGKVHKFRYVVKLFKDVWPFQLTTSKWCREKHVPTFEDYMTHSIHTIGLRACTVVSFLGLGDIATQEVFEWALRFPKAIQALCTMARLEDDRGEDDPKGNVTTEGPSAISCYMKQHKMANKDQAYEDIRKILDDAWKDINQALLRPTIMPIPVLERILAQARLVYTMYQGGDGFTSSYKTPMKENIALLFKDPIPM